MAVFKDYATYYNAVYQDKNYKSEALDIINLLKLHTGGGGIKSLINFGCGTGKHDIEFFKLGYSCSGIDLSREMIEIANENAKKQNANINFQVADVREFYPAKKFDAVISLFHVMSYQNSNQDILNAFKSARRCLNQDGIFIFDAWFGPGVLTDRPTVRLKELNCNDKIITRIATPVMHPNKNIVDVNYLILIIDKNTNITSTIRETHSMRYFFKPEIELLLNLANFKLINNLDCKNLNETDFNSWTSYFIAQAV